MFISKRKHEPAHYMLKIESFSLLSEAKTLMIESDVFDASGHKWRLNLYPNGNDEKNVDSHISIYVVICDTEKCSKGWEVCVDVCFFAYDHIHNHFVTFQDVNGHRTRFHEKMKTWGFDKLISLESFMESESGYVFNDSCVFGVEVFAVPQFAQVDRCLFMTKPPTTMNSHTWTIDNFSAVTEDVLHSEVFKVGKVKWKLFVYPKGGTAAHKGAYLSIFLHVHDSDSFPDGWKVYANVKFRVKGRGTKADKEKEAERWFCTEDWWGFPNFVLMSELNDSENGYLVNDNLTLEVEMSVMGTLKSFI